MKNKKQLFKGILGILSFFIATIVFIFIYESISYVKYQSNDDSQIEKIAKVENNLSSFLPINSSNKLDKHRTYIECMEKEDILVVDCDKIKQVVQKNISKVIPKLKEKDLGYVPFKDLSESNLIIKVIYFFLILSLFQQTYLFLLSRFGCFLDIFDFHKSEWAINVAPMFGLLGTFFSMAMLLNANNENIDTALVKNFFDAVMTTIIGIIFYIINFYLKVSIYPRITEQKND